jgi:hypothetical protein
LALLFVSSRIVTPLQGGFASLGGFLEALALLVVLSKIGILLQGRFAGFVGCLDLLSRYPNDRHRSTSDSPVSSEKCDAMRVKTSPLFELALVLVRFDHVASRIVNANHGIM